MRKTFVMAAAAMMAAMSVGLGSCKGGGAAYPHVEGTLDGPLPADSAPAPVLEALAQAQRYHQYEIMSDTTNQLSVEAIAEADTVSTQGYGITVVKGATSTTFRDLRNTRQPKACYDAQAGVLWLATSAMEGTGVAVERLFQIRFSDADSASVAYVVEPFDVQQQLCQRLGYRIEGQKVSLYDGQRLLAQTTNTVTDMGGFDSEQPVWIGEQLQFDLSAATPRLLVTPGVKFTTGLVLTYDDMPTLSAPVTIGSDGRVNIGQLEAEPFQ